MGPLLPLFLHFRSFQTILTICLRGCHSPVRIHLRSLLYPAVQIPTEHNIVRILCFVISLLARRDTNTKNEAGVDWNLNKNNKNSSHYYLGRDLGKFFLVTWKCRIIYRKLGSGCGAVARADTSDTRVPGFESSRRQLLLNIFTSNCL